MHTANIIEITNHQLPKICGHLPTDAVLIQLLNLGCCEIGPHLPSPPRN